MIRASSGEREPAAMSEACALCGRDRANPTFEKDGIPYYRCPGCRFVFSRPAANANFETALDDYEPAYLQYLEESPEDERNFSALLDFAVRFHDVAGSRVLDVGTGSGKLVRFLRRRSIEACGIEPAGPLYSRFLANEEFFLPHTLEEFSERLPIGRFGVVFACDVIEHVERPDSFLECASRALEPGGVVIVSTPDVESLLARISGRRWHYYNKYHLSYLSRSSIARVAERCGLREVGFARPARLRSLGYLLQYFADFVLGGSRVRVPARLNRIAIPINLFDMLAVVLEKRE